MKGASSPGRHLIALGFLLALCGNAGAGQHDPDPVALVAGQTPIALGRHIEVLRDDSRKLTFDDVRAAPYAAQFETHDTEIFSFGFVTPAVYWYRMRLHNPGGDDKTTSDWVLQQLYPWLDYVDIYVTRQDGGTELIYTGGRRQPSSIQLSDRSIAIPLQIAPGEEVALHLRVLSETGHQVALAAWTRGGFHGQATKEHLWFGVLYGILLVMILYNLFIYLWIRDRAYFYYVLYIVAIIFWAFIYSGHAREYINPLFSSAPDWVHASYPLSLTLAVLCANLFAPALLRIDQQSPRIRIAFRSITAVSVLSLLLYPLIPYEISLQLGLLLSAVTAVTALTVGTYLSLKGQRTARFYLLAWGLFLASSIIVVLSQYGWLPVNAFTTYAWNIGACIEVTILSLALADRINVERQEKFAAQGAVLAAHEKAVKGEEHVNRLKSFLPRRVAELLVAGGDNTVLEPRRRRVTVCVIDLRGFTPFSEAAEPEDVMGVLREFYTTMGDIVERHGGTVEHFAGDSMLIFFNAPLELPAAEEHATRAAVEMRESYAELRERWALYGHDLGLGIGIAAGFATIGAIGFSGRSQYAAIGAVTNLAARLCSMAMHNEILTTSQMLPVIEHIADCEQVGTQSIRGFKRPVEIARVLRLREAAGTLSSSDGTRS